jgi:alpha-glucosidase (family GH31 glycosyl hydrolase)
MLYNLLNVKRLRPSLTTNKLWLATLFVFVLSASKASAQEKNQPKADPQATVVEGGARFTILTPRLLRMEWSNSKEFVDDASLVVINRKLPLPSFRTERQNGWLVIRTSEVELRYHIGTGKFTSENLSVKWLRPQNSFTWNAGVTQRGNLQGTARTLDGRDGDHYSNGEKINLGPGLLSTEGWTLIDDSKSLLFDQSSWQWVKNRPTGEEQDWYFMAYGHNYKQAIYDYTCIAGKIPLPPRYAFGYWWSRYWSYSDNEVRQMVNNFSKYNLPLDVFVVDMDWHYTDSLRAKGDAFGSPQHWTGWTWNRRLFPNPDAFLKYMKNDGLKVTLNLHPASGIAPYEEPYAQFAKAMQFDTSTHKNIPFAASNKAYMKTLFDVVLHPMEKKGIDFWWLDWQQWPNDKAIPSLSNTWWLNYVFFSDMEKNTTKRPMLYHRWGGLGNHRYQIGFSGDAIISWKSLAYQPYFTSTASNVLYGYWSHDIGGHYFDRGGQTFDPELYARWMQFGALSPIFRTHSGKNATVNKDIWNFRGEYYDALTDAIQLRYQLHPYIYTMARKAYDTGISLCRPLYYDYPEEKAAYTDSSEYKFGDDLLVAPIGAPMKEGLSKMQVWLPPGNSWFEWNTGTLLKGGQTVTRSFSITEYPLYAKAGAVIPLYPTVKNLNQQPQQQIIGLFPGGDGETTIYEDQGNSKDYATAYATTKVTSKHLTGRQQVVTILPRKGTYPQMPTSRTYALRLFGAEMPQAILVNGKKLDYTMHPDQAHWSYDGNNLTVNIPLPKQNCSVKQTVTIQYSKTESADINTGLVRNFRRLTKAMEILKSKDADIILPEIAGRCEETGLQLQYYPGQYYKTLQYFKTNYPKVVEATRERTNAKNAEWLENYLKQD